MIEIWKDIKGYEGIYQVSNTGKVRSLDRKVWNYIKKGRILKPHDNGHGYYNVSLSDGDKKSKHTYIHILVAEAFIPNPNNYTQVNHKDFNKANNAVDNLEWVSPQQNILHFRQSHLYKKVSQNKHRTLTNKTLDFIYKNKDKVLEEYDKGLSIVEVSKKLGICRDRVSDILKLYDRL